MSNLFLGVELNDSSDIELIQYVKGYHFGFSFRKRNKRFWIYLFRSNQFLFFSCCLLQQPLFVKSAYTYFILSYKTEAFFRRLFVISKIFKTNIVIHLRERFIFVKNHVSLFVGARLVNKMSIKMNILLNCR